MTPGANRMRGVFGALALDGPDPGAWHYSITERKRTDEFLTFLEQLLVCYPTEPLYLVLDNASIHTSKLTRAWIAEHPQVTLCFLPSYAGHRENPVEKVQRRICRERTRRLARQRRTKHVQVLDISGPFPEELSGACRTPAWSCSRAREPLRQYCTRLAPCTARRRDR